ncbi:MAG: hypothetical protein LZ172_07630, partial [Thaumarchaeota archaeon]|jgi:uncharacterized membrane protein|nr:hypothetical protein [Candidatus Geocrenenecus arthurdayi]MCL7404196.1 hypothetical protein [Candidatus Geocrenenecus arthurdayi]
MVMLRKSLGVVAAALCASLYAAASLSTAYIPTPWIVQLRPAVVIPAIFSVCFGPWVGGIGAAIGTFIASILTYGSPVLTLFSGFWANLVCFYIIGRLSRPFNNRNFAAGILIGFLAGSVIIGFGLWFLFTYLPFMIPMGTYAYKVFESALPSILKDPALWILGTIVWTLATGGICTYLIGLPVIHLLRKVYPAMIKAS